jgi:hypothetical protein
MLLCSLVVREERTEGDTQEKRGKVRLGESRECQREEKERREKVRTN